MYFKTDKGFDQVKRLLPGCHIEQRRGTHAQARDYASKDDTRVSGPWSYGVEPTAGKRTDISSACELLRSTKRLRSVADEYPDTFVKFGSGLMRYLRVVMAPRSFKTEGWYIYGPTGTGKSRLCSERWPGAYWLPQGKWFDGYDGEETVIIDEFYGWLQPSYILRLIDRYPLLVECKGGMLQFVAKRVVFTSNVAPWDLWPSLTFDRAPFKRRLEFILRKDSLGTDPIVETWSTASVSAFRSSQLVRSSDQITSLLSRISSE